MRDMMEKKKTDGDSGTREITARRDEGSGAGGVAG
jgi:hypothetical protein